MQYRIDQQSYHSFTEVIQKLNGQDQVEIGNGNKLVIVEFDFKGKVSAIALTDAYHNKTKITFYPGYAVWHFEDNRKEKVEYC